MADPVVLETQKTADSIKRRPLVKWAQRSDTILLTVSVEDIHNEKLKAEHDRLHISCAGGQDNVLYEVNMKFLKEVEPKGLRTNKTDRELYIALQKKENSTTFWPRLLNTTEKQHWLKIDFGRWKDEDDSDIDEEGNFEDMMRKMGGGVPQDEMLEGVGDEEEDSDDEELPDLE